MERLTTKLAFFQFFSGNMSGPNTKSRPSLNNDVARPTKDVFLNK